MAAQGTGSGLHPLGLPARCQALAQLQGQATPVKTHHGDLLGATGALGHGGKAARATATGWTVCAETNRAAAAIPAPRPPMCRDIAYF